MSKGRALILVIALWALIYLPGLGSREIKGEEGRRILPAITMLQGGNFLVPQVGSDPYFTKPPLVNWLVAGSFKLFGQRNEWTARLPSTICVLLVALAFVTVARASLGADGSLIGALVWLTSFGLIEKGRLIEIEALYVSITALATICWLSWWQTGRSKWLTWTVPWIFLGLGWLAKGPLHLVFFYAVVAAVLYQRRMLKSLWEPAHFVGIAIMLGIFAAWAIPCLLLMQESNVAHVWSRQFSGRLSGEDFKFSGWIMNIPRGLGYFLPWTLLLPLLFLKRPTLNVQRPTSKSEEATSTLNVGRWTLDVQRALLWGIVISFLIISLLPGSLPRYTMPLLGPASFLAALLLTERRQLRLVLVIAAVTATALLIYGFALIPQLKSREKVRPVAARINAILPPGIPLYAVDPDYQPFLFYVRDPIVYVRAVDEVPTGARFLLVQPRDQPQVSGNSRWTIEGIHQLRDYRDKQVVLLQVSD